MSERVDGLHGRLLVVAFEGWNDAGEAATGVVRTLRDSLDVTPLTELDAEVYVDYQFNRPTIATNDDGTRSLTWPGITFYGPAPDGTEDAARETAQKTPDASSPRDVFLLLGTEPARRWRTFTAEILQLIEDHRIESIVMLGSMLADVPHTRPISVFVSSENAGLRSRLDLEKSNYEGPIGILSVLSAAAAEAGIPTLSIWASVPHYVHNAPSPKATLAIVQRLEQIIGIDIPRGDLVDESVAWEDGINALAQDDDDMASYIEQLERARDTVDSPAASGDAIAEEFERYLRKRDGKADGRERS